MDLHMVVSGGILAYLCGDLPSVGGDFTTKISLNPG